LDQSIDQDLQGNSLKNPKYEAAIDGLFDHNFAVVDDFFEPNLIDGLYQELLRQIDQENLRLAGIGQGTEYDKIKTIRGDKIKWIGKSSGIENEVLFLSAVEDFWRYLNQTCFTGVQGAEFHYAVYEKGTFYKRHLDQFKNDDSRKFSIITYFNQDWKPEDGGELVLYLPNQTLKIEPIWGRTVFLRSELIEHEVALNHQQRLSVTGWLK
jgi:SM-20-related protein